MKKIKFLPLFLLALIIGCKSFNYKELGDGVFADIKTNKGSIIVELTYEATPVTVANFVCLAEGTNPFVVDSLKGKKYYEGVIFHRVIKDFMIQGGDPTGTGKGGPGYRFEDEIVDTLVHDGPGILSMANAGKNTNGSQFFITHAPTPHLNGKHAVFGKVVAGIEVVDTIATTKTGDRNRPVEDVVMQKVKIVRNGDLAKAFDPVQVMTLYFDEVAKKEEAFQKAVTDLEKEFESQKNSIEALPSGLKILKLKEGEGEKPKIGQKVLVNYAGYLTDASLFDSNLEDLEIFYKKHNPQKAARGLYNPTPMQYSPDSPLVPGFKEGLLQMKVGDKVRLFIPSHLGYGAAGFPPVIPPNADLVFDLEIIDILKK